MGHHWTKTETNLADDPVQSARGISTGEDIFVHEQAPNEVLVLPDGADTSNLEEKDTIVVEEVVNLAQELTIAPDTDMLQSMYECRLSLIP